MSGTWDAWVADCKERHDTANAPVVGNPGTFSILSDFSSRGGMRLRMAEGYAEGAISYGAVRVEILYTPEES